MCLKVDSLVAFRSAPHPGPIIQSDGDQESQISGTSSSCLMFSLSLSLNVAIVLVDEQCGLLCL